MSADILQSIWAVVGRKMVVPPGVDFAIIIAFVACQALGCVGTVGGLQSLSKLAAQIPDGKLEDRAAFLRYALGVPLGLLLAMAAIIELQYAVRLRSAGQTQVLACVSLIDLGVTSLPLCSFASGAIH